MFWRWVIPAVVGAVVAVEAEIIAVACRALVFSRFLRWFQLGFVVKDVEGHGGRRVSAVVADFSGYAMVFAGFNACLSFL